MIINEGLGGEIEFKGTEESDEVTIRSKAHDPLIKREDTILLMQWLCVDFLRWEDLDKFRRWFEKEFWYMYDNN